MRFDALIRLLLASAIAVAAGVRVPAAAFRSQHVGRLLDGEGLFRAYCASCHGRTGKGDGPTARALKRPPPDLTLLAQRSGGRLSRERVAELALTEGQNVRLVPSRLRVFQNK